MKALVPEAGLATFRREMDRVLERFWDGDEMPGAMGWTPDVDVAETHDAVTVRAEVPGIDPKELVVTLENGILILRGEKRQVIGEKEERLYRNERHYGSFVRGLRLPVNVDASKVTATFKNGVLTILMPKTAEAKGRAIPISIL